MTTNSKSTSSASADAINIITVRPRASSLVVQAIEVAGFSLADTRILRRMADHARFASEGDRRRWKVEDGEVFSYAKAATVARELGLADARTVRRAVRSGRAAGILEVRQCDRSRSAYVWVTSRPVPASVKQCDTTTRQIRPTIRPTILADRNHVRTTKKPTRQVLSTCGVAVSDADAPPTARQREVIHAMCMERGLAAHVPRTRRQASDWISGVQRMGGRAFKRVLHVDAAPTTRQKAMIGLLTNWRQKAKTRAEAATIIETRGRVA